MTYTFNPSDAMRHAAAQEGAENSATTAPVTVTVRDRRGAGTTQTLAVPVSPKNSNPTASSTVGSPDAVTGVLTGAVNATDADGDALTYSAQASTTKGSVSINSSTGAFTYAPTSTARLNAGKPGATDADKADTFTVTISDGYGGGTAVPINVVVSPTRDDNRAPIPGTPVVGTPDASTGAVTGSVSATDADGDTLTYTAPVSTSKGAVNVNASTGAFTYTPTAAARQNAGRTGASQSDKADTFTVTIVDGYGASVAVPVNVPVSPIAPPVTAEIGSWNGVTEGNSGVNSVAAVGVRLSAPSTQRVTVSYTIAEIDGLSPAATPGRDFVAETGTLVFEPGETSAQIPIKVIGDTEYEPSEYVYVGLTGASGAVLSADGMRKVGVKIENDDQPPGSAATMVATPRTAVGPMHAAPTATARQLTNPAAAVSASAAAVPTRRQSFPGYSRAGIGT